MKPLIPYFSQPDIPIGPLTVHGFGIMVALGFWLGGLLAQKKAERFTADPDAGDRVNRMVSWLVVGAVAGGHLGHVLFYEPAVLLADPMKLLRFWDGLSSFGGFTLCVPLTIWFFRKERKPYFPYADALAWGFGLGFGIGRLGCFWAHDHPGRQTDFWLGVYGICPGGNPDVACHDMGLYEALWVFGILGVMLVASRKPRAPGTYLGLLAMLYGPVRIAMDFLRHPDGVDTRYLGLTPAQYGSLLVTGLGVAILATRKAPPAAQRAPTLEVPPPATDTDEPPRGNVAP